MPGISLRAHYDGEHILLDEPFELAANAQLIITVVPEPSGQFEPGSMKENSAGVMSDCNLSEPEESEFARKLRELPKLPMRPGPPVTLEFVNELRDALD